MIFVYVAIIIKERKTKLIDERLH